MIMAPETADVHSIKTHALYIHDTLTHTRFLVDIEAEVSIHCDARSTIELYPTNGTKIHMSGEKSITLNLGPSRNLNWIFLIAYVKNPIIDMTFFITLD